MGEYIRECMGEYMGECIRECMGEKKRVYERERDSLGELMRE